MQKSLIPDKKTNEWLEFISRLGLVNIGDARAVFLSGDYTQLADLGQKALYTAGRGKTLSLEGNLIGSKMSFDEAQLLAETRNAEQNYASKDEILAYVHYERAVFFEKYGEMFNGMSLFRSAKRLVESKPLDAVIDYQISAIQLEDGTGSSAKQAQNWIKYFADSGMQIMHIIALRRLAKHFRIQGEFGETEQLLMSALELGIDYEYPFLVEQIKNSYGYLLYSKGDLAAARDLFQRLANNTESKYIKSTVLENLYLIFYDEKEYAAAADHLGQAVDHCQKYSIISQLPDECRHLGDLYREKLQQPEIATHYYNIGSQAALKMAEYGFSLKGDRLAVVKRFEQRAKVGYSLPESLGSQEPPFAFAIGKTWKQINDLFQFYLIRNHLESGNNVSSLPAKLGLKPSTYYAIKRRLSQHGFNFEGNTSQLPISLKKREQVTLRAYVNGLTELTWNKANQHFEKEIIEFLFKQVGYQKTKLADELKVSYPTILQKTRSLGNV
ncbi:MAG: tetratricopeptide repeat protein [Candidatus Marinimicrobia bacterium]|nr:tetratricopeptide repeat protein [Candidatus Neomarinimicrobiota bacterium]